MDSSRNGLMRIICLDAHVPGKLMTINVSEHANLSGTNGAGKTTLLKLTPFFYGSSPTDVIPRKSTRTRFVDYYLPRPTSMIIYEYRTDRGLMCAVVYRHSSGEKPAYRFLAEAFCNDYFSEIREGQRCYIEGRELGRLWNSEHLEHSKQIEVTMDYRAVIQGDAELINRTGDKELRKLAVQFSLSGKIGKMRYIDKMATAILGRSGNMDRIKSMLADIMQEDNVVPPSINLHRGIKSEIASLGILRDLDRNEDLFNSVITKGTSYQENVQATGRIHTELGSIKQVLLHRIAEDSQKFIALDEALSSHAAAWEDREFLLKGQATDANVIAKNVERQLNTLNEAYQRWEDSGIHTMIVDYEQLDRLHNLHKSALQRLDRLEDDVQDVQRQYSEAAAQEASRHHLASNMLQEKIREFENEITDIQAEWAERKIGIIQQLGINKESVRESYQKELDKLREDIAQAKLESQHAHSTEEEKTSLDLAEASRDDAEDSVASQDTLCEAELQKLEILVSARLRADEKLLEASRDADSSSAKRDAMLALCRPAPGSLLAEMRDKQPLWYHTVGRIIRPELLLRKDLAPVLCDHPGEDIYGWQLAHQRIETPEWATTLEQQERRLQVSEDNLDQALEYRKECELNLAKANKAYTDQRDSSEEAKRKRSRLKGLHEAATEAV
jgi:hypothetical protein